MNVEFYFDPSCPFSWITSRWLLMVSNHRAVNVKWKPFSLALKNNALLSGDSNDTYAKLYRSSHRVLRVMLAAQNEFSANLIDLYTSSGIKHHIAGNKFDDKHISEVLVENNLPVSLLKFADNTKYDEQLKEYIASAIKVTGDDIGVPTIIFVNQKGEEQGFFGPVLQYFPGETESLEVWDGLSKLATSESFYELKRSRPSGDPDVGSTARC